MFSFWGGGGFFGDVFAFLFHYLFVRFFSYSTDPVGRTAGSDVNALALKVFLFIFLIIIMFNFFL